MKGNKGMKVLGMHEEVEGGSESADVLKKKEVE